MISFFRRALTSWLSIGLFVLVVAAFVLGDAMSMRMSGPSGDGSDGDTIAIIGKQRLSASDITERMQTALEAARQQDPEMDMAKFVASGGLDDVIAQTIDDRVLYAWGQKYRIGASQRLIDGEIASIPAFAGVTGKFDPEVMRALLAQRQLTEGALRADIAVGAIRRQLLYPIATGVKAPNGLVLPYASLLLEAREGLVGAVPTAVLPAGPAPTEAEIAAFYKANTARYEIPERRVLRYALIDAERAKATPPTEAEIAAYYKDNAAHYAARETRRLSQVILPDEKAAQTFAASAKSAGFAAAASKAGFTTQDTTIGEVDRDAYAKTASAAIAAAAFAAPQGGLTAPVKGDLGWYVVKVDAVKTIAARPLAAVRDEIAALVATRKGEDALNALASSVGDAISGGSSFEDVAKANGLTVITTPPLIADGRAPEQPGYEASADVKALLKDAFLATPDDDPTIATIENGKRYAMLGVARIIDAAPAPLASIHDRVAADLKARRASDKAKAIATAIVAKMKGGATMAAAVAGAGVTLPSPQKAAARQMDVARAGQQAPAPLVALFEMRKGETKIIPSDRGDAWLIVHLDTIKPGDAKTQPGLVDATRTQFSDILGQDFAQQFVAAAAHELGIKRYPQAVAKLKARLTGATADQ